MRNLPTYIEYLSENKVIFSNYMLEWKIFENGELKEVKTMVSNTLRSIYEYMKINKITDCYKISGRKNSKWESLVNINF